MIIFLIILSYLLLCGLGILFYYLHKRLEDLSGKLSGIISAQNVLYENQTTLQDDLKKVNHELQNIKKDHKK